MTGSELGPGMNAEKAEGVYRTFNVNGKMPSQDLSSWVRGSVDDKGLSILPPLKKVSPFAIDDSNPIESARSQAATSSSEANTLTEASAPASIASASTTSLTFVQTEPEVVSTVPIDQTHPSDPDMLILGFQELDLSTAALTYSTSSVREEAWTTAIFAGLGEKGDMYEKLASKQLVGMLIIIIVKKSLKECFSNVMTSSVGVGIMGYMGNKGGTAIRLTFTPPDITASTPQADTNTPTTSKSDTQGQQHKTGSEDFNLGSTALTFVCAHLAAFDEMVLQRNADYHSLGKRLVFDSQTIIPSGSDAEDIPHSLRQGLPEKFSIFESDALFWLGDLNYRVDLPDAEVRTLLQSNHWENGTEILMKYDQLKKAIHHKEAFEIFTEPEITHRPTYRFSPGVLSDSLGYDVKRRPAWTDRVLYVHSPLTTQLQPLAYVGHHEITMSDHRPVSAKFALDVDLYDRYQLHATATSLFQQVYGMEDLQERSKLKLSETNVDLGGLFYKRQKTYTLSVQNTGTVPVAFRFVPAHQELELHPNWLKISPMTGLLLPKELIEITLTAMVDNDIASELNTGLRDLSSTLILHTLMGKDLFVVVSATYNYTCFANKLSRMTQLPGPIRSLQGPEELLREDRAINAPREVMRLVNWMMTAENSVGDMFTSPADQDVVDRLRECLDTGEEFPYSEDTEDSTVLVAFGETLRQLLDSLTECLIPVSLHAQCVSATDRDEAFEALDSFPPAAVNVWISVTAFLHFVVQQSSDPEGMAQKIAAIFTPVFFGLLRSDVAEASFLGPFFCTIFTDSINTSASSKFTTFSRHSQSNADQLGRWSHGPYSGAFKRIMTYSYILSVPCIFAYSLGFAIIKYNEGWVAAPLTGVIMPKPYTAWRITLVIFFPRDIENEITQRDAAKKKWAPSLNYQQSFMSESNSQRNLLPSMPSSPLSKSGTDSHPFIQLDTEFNLTQPQSAVTPLSPLHRQLGTWDELDEEHEGSEATLDNALPLKPNRRRGDDVELDGMGASLTRKHLSRHNRTSGGVNPAIYNYTSPINLVSRPNTTTSVADSRFTFGR
ncbi:hypothetical protein D9758_005326 [Tetrapyrgos nigripes]|uniref:Uncharacterized protein n=1 Tax=Tetrapyrgos nigripes TaxID=182062 RepID=A0A8H5LPZ7_9AGAR|nr:hypothetical protein D9758_005326 [Tetrapyrgos nigripes]